MIPTRLYTSSRAEVLALENLGVSSLDVLGATASHAYDDSFSVRTPWYQYTGSAISENDFNRQYGNYGIPYDPNITEELADFLVEKKRVRERDEYVMSLGKGGLMEEGGQLVGAVVAANLTPINLAASFIPIGGQAKWAAAGLKYGKLKTGLAKGFAGGAVGQTALEPFIYYERGLEGRDYSIRDSADNILMSGAFGAGLHGGIYGFKKLKDRYFTTPEILDPAIGTDNPVINRQFKELMASLQDKDYPHFLLDGSASTSQTEFDLSEAMRLKNSIWQEGASKFLELFAQELKASQLEERLHREFATSGDKSKIPEALLKQLDTENNRVEYLREQYGSDSEFVEIQRRLADLDSGILNRLEYEQQELQAYNLDLRDLHIAARQLEEGMHIDLADPKNAKSIYETDRNPELLEMDIDPHTVLGKQNVQITQGTIQDTPLSKAVEFVQEHQSRKIGFSEYLRQTDLRQQSIAKELLCGLMLDMEKSNLTHFFKNKNYSRDIARELANLTSNRYRQGYTGSKQSLEVAHIVHRWQTIARERANRAGADIARLPGYITRQMHSSKALRDMGYAKWQDFITPLLDIEQTGDIANDINLREVFNNLASGLHFDSLDSQIPFPSARSSGNLAKTLSESRKLHFKSAESWLIYNEKCGEYGLSDSILLSLESLGKATGMLDMFGERPAETFGKLKSILLEDLKELSANGDKIATREIKYFKSKKSDDIFDIMLGGNCPDNPTLAAICSSIRALKSMSSLGSVMISSLPDMATWVGELANNGVPLLKSYSCLLTDLLSTMTSKDKRSFAKALGIASDTALGLSYNRLNSEYPGIGWSSKLSNLFFKLNCMHWWDSSFKSAMGLVLSNNLADLVHLKFNKLPKLLRNQLSRYGINENNWYLYSFLKQREGDNNYLIPDGSLIPGHILEEYLTGTNRRAELSEVNKQILRDNLASSLRRYYLDRVDSAIATPHASDRAFVTGGTKSGTWVGEFVRFFMQFKSFPVNYIRRPLYASAIGRVHPRERSGIFTEDMKTALGSSGTITAMTHLLMGSTIFGYLSIYAKNLLSSKELPDPEDPKVWMASVVKGGGLGIFGDFIFNEYDRYGRTFLQEAAGPVFGEINSVASIVSKYKQSEVTKAEAEALKLFFRNIPGQNLFYLQPAIIRMQNH